MPNPGLDPVLMQEAVDLYERYGRSKAKAAKAANLPVETFRNRLQQGLVAGLRPRAPQEYVRPTNLHRLGRVHMVIPDIQAKPDVSHEHLRWIANYALDKRPDVIIQIGDWADMPSLSLYDKGKRCYEGRRYVKDIDAANFSLNLFEETIENHNRAHPEDQYTPRKVVTLGNHEYRIDRATQLDSALHGKLKIEDLDLERRGWEVYPFLEIVTIDGVEYSHYFTSGNMGRPVTTAAALLRERQSSATMGHTQYADMAIHKKTMKRALFAGVCYLHDEDYLGPQGNNVRRQVIMKHEVQDGLYDLMEVSLNFLRKRYS
jgi:hypothetical protein